MNSANYGNQQGYPTLPIPGLTPGLPVLTITLVAGNARVAWAASATSFTLQESIHLGASASWVNLPGPYLENAGERYLLVPAVPPSRFYRLIDP